MAVSWFIELSSCVEIALPILMHHFVSVRSDASPEAERVVLNRGLRPALSDAEWDLLVADGWIEDIEATGQDGRGEALAFIERGRSVWGRSSSRGQRKPTVGISEEFPARRLALSYHLWLQAQQDEEVRRFRSAALQGTLFDGIASWEQIFDRLEKAGEPAGRPVPPKSLGGYPVVATLVWRNGQLHIEPGSDLAVIGYLIEDDEGEKKVVIDPANPSHWNPNAQPDAVRWLATLAEDLAESYGWMTTQAADFLVTNRCPLVPVVKVEWVKREETAASRIVIRADPSATSGDIRLAYESARKSVSQRRGSISEKHAMLVRHNFVGPLLGHAPWADRLAHWNLAMKDRPEWQYSYESNFRRDVLRAQAKLFRPSYGDFEDNGPETMLDVELVPH